MKAKMHDIGALLTARFAVANTSATAGGSGDATEVSGAWIDVTNYESLKVLVPYTTTLAADATLSFAANLQDATAIGGTNAADFGTAVAATVVRTGAVTAGTGVVEMDFDVSQARGFVRVQLTPDLSAANTDTLAFSAVYVLGGAQRQPATAKIN